MEEKMMKRISVIFVLIFSLMLTIPLICTNLRDGTVSAAENRRLADKPGLYLDDGRLNLRYISDFETWFNDNVGLRSQLVAWNAKLQYAVFGKLSEHTDYYLGEQGELNYATSGMIRDYAHVNLFSEKEIEDICESFQFINDWLEKQEIRFYYFQCWDKHSIYPEYFMRGINQYGDMSRTDQVIKALNERTTVNVISPKQMLIDEKENYHTYSVWGDATHWTQRGAWLSYVMLMNAINAKAGNHYRTLREEDYDITITDQGQTVIGGIHKVDMEENFVIKNAGACQTDEAPIYLSQWQNKSRTIFKNDSAGNKDTIVIIGDSYFDSFLVDDIAESFDKTVLIWGDYLQNMQEIIEYYEPAVVVCENAERCCRFEAMVSLAETLCRE